jgi:hypothetical protein
MASSKEAVLILMRPYHHETFFIALANSAWTGAPGSSGEDVARSSTPGTHLGGGPRAARRAAFAAEIAGCCHRYIQAHFPV